MSNKVFQQNLDDKKGSQPGGPYLIQMLFKEPVEMPDKEKMTAIMEKYIGSTECFCYDKKMAGFAAQEHIAEFKDGKCPVQLMVMKCDKFKGKGFDAFLMSQMWDCQEDRERIFRECRYQVVATDMLAAALPALERANLDADFLEALAELYPTCEAFYFQNCGKLFPGTSTCRIHSGMPRSEICRAIARMLALSLPVSCRWRSGSISFRSRMTRLVDFISRSKPAR